MALGSQTGGNGGKGVIGGVGPGFSFSLQADMPTTIAINGTMAYFTNGRTLFITNNIYYKP
jgi:hypothetical protein